MDCQICLEPITVENLVRYQINPIGPVAKNEQICGDCLEGMLESQNQSVTKFVETLTDLQNCSKQLKGLLQGRVGVPTRLHDLVIFPNVNEDEVVPNSICPRFGRKNEVARLWIGEKEVSTALEQAPSSQAEVVQLLREICKRLESKLTDYDDELSNQIRQDVQLLLLKLGEP